MQYYGTLGPSCGDEKILENMFCAGMTGIRLNLSHGDLDKSSHWLELLREAAMKAGIKGAPQILIDLQGPELRLGRNGITCELESGETVQLVSMGAAGQMSGESIQTNLEKEAESEHREAAKLCIPVPDMLLYHVEAGDRILVDDGKIELLVKAVSGGTATTAAVNTAAALKDTAGTIGAVAPENVAAVNTAAAQMDIAAATGAAIPANTVAVNTAAAQMDTAGTTGAAAPAPETAANIVTANTTASNITESPSDTAVTGAAATGAAAPATAPTPTVLPVSVSAVVVRPGTLKPGKSLAVIGKELPMPTLTDSDHKNIGMAAEYGVTGVMLPFVRNREDLLTLRSALQAAGAEKVEIFAKIENMQGVHAIDELLPWCDQIVIARGDLGNAMPLWKLPGIQKQLAASCRAKKKPFMVVTQMLDSMHERAVPTRAEVLDIYNAVLDGAASVMLTGETAAGRYPVEAMEYLVRTGEEAVKDRACEADR